MTLDSEIGIIPTIVLGENLLLVEFHTFIQQRLNLKPTTQMKTL